jgi:hypothetical protein
MGAGHGAETSEGEGPCSIELLADGENSGGGIPWGLIIAVVIYLLPAQIAHWRHVRNAGSVTVINVFLGWTFVGWVVALAMAVRTVEASEHSDQHQDWEQGK